jgi:hypothetical protein
MLSHRARYKLENIWLMFRPWLFGSLSVGLLIFLWYFLSTVGPGAAIEEVPEAVQPEDPAVVKLTEEVTELEKQYQVYASANITSDEAHNVLVQAVDKQRALVRFSLKGDYTYQTKLELLESELAGLRAKRTVGRIEALEKEGEEARDALNLPKAQAALEEALKLQREINASSAAPRFKNFVRETTLESAITSLAVLPIFQEKEASLAKARAAVNEERWADALAGYISARDSLERINRDYGRTRYANLGEFDRIESEIASLNAAGVAAAIDQKEEAGDAADRAGDYAAAATSFADALALQQQINDRFSRSRFVSSKRIEDLEVKFQTARSRPLALDLAKIDRLLSENLRKRRVVVAEQDLPQAVALTKRLAEEFPRSKAVDGELRIKLNYLVLKGAELRKIQDEVYDRLLPLIGVTDRLLLASETPQGLYQAIMNTNPSRSPGRALPVDSVNWLDAQEFCARLGWILGTEVRLPTEQEFRTAVGKGGGDVRSSAEGGRVGSTESGKANVNGYRDLLGNLAEWTVAPTQSDEAQVAGGSYLDTPEVIKHLPLESRPKVDRARHIGFRFVVILPPDRA